MLKIWSLPFPVYEAKSECTVCASHPIHKRIASPTVFRCILLFGDLVALFTLVHLQSACLPLCISNSRPVLLFTVTVKLLSRVRPRLSAQVLLCFVCDWKRSQRETEEVTEINWMYRGEGILKQILTESDRDLGSHSFLSVKVTRAITRHTDERTLSEGMCSVDWRSVVIFSWKYLPESLAPGLVLKHMANSRSFKYLL